MLKKLPKKGLIMEPIKFPELIGRRMEFIVVGKKYYWNTNAEQVAEYLEHAEKIIFKDIYNQWRPWERRIEVSEIFFKDGYESTTDLQVKIVPKSKAKVKKEIIHYKKEDLLEQVEIKLADMPNPIDKRIHFEFDNIKYYWFSTQENFDKLKKDVVKMLFVPTNVPNRFGQRLRCKQLFYKESYQKEKLVDSTGIIKASFIIDPINFTQLINGRMTFIFNGKVYFWNTNENQVEEYKTHAMKVMFQDIPNIYRPWETRIKVVDVIFKNGHEGISKLEVSNKSKKKEKKLPIPQVRVFLNNLPPLIEGKVNIIFEGKKYYWEATKEEIEHYKEIATSLIFVPIGDVNELGLKLRRKKIIFKNGDSKINEIIQAVADNPIEEKKETQLIANPNSYAARRKSLEKTQIFKVVKNIVSDKHQQLALKQAIEHDVSLIIGYAGTGKSFTATKIADHLENLGWSISRVAPTGKAAQIIGGGTIHSWLEPILETDKYDNVKIIGWMKNRLSKKECLIIDESSMINDEIWAEISRVWENSKHSDKKMIIVGDPGQLEPIGIGKPFIDLIENEAYPITELKTIYRSDKDNDIILYSAKTRKKKRYINPKGYHNVNLVSKEQAIEAMIKHHDVQILCPKKKEVNGTGALNKVIQTRINQASHKTNKRLFSSRWFDQTINDWANKDAIFNGERIIIIKNMWQWNITNGTTGIIKGIRKVKLYNHITRVNRLRSCIEIFNDATKEIFYLPNNEKTRRAIDLAYAITIHKAQGSEFREIYLFLTPDQKSFVNIKSLYTAITRAKEKVNIVID